MTAVVCAMPCCLVLCRAVLCLNCCVACSYSLHNKNWAFFNAKDQTQSIANNLLNLAASALNVSDTLLTQLRQHTALNICKLYRDPFSRLVRLRSRP